MLFFEQVITLFLQINYFKSIHIWDGLFIFFYPTHLISFADIKESEKVESQRTPHGMCSCRVKMGLLKHTLLKNGTSSALFPGTRPSMQRKQRRSLKGGSCLLPKDSLNFLFVDCFVVC